MSTVKFGDSKEFKIVGAVGHPYTDGVLYISLPVASVDASELIKALDNYGGTITEYDDNGDVVGQYKEYEDRPSFTTIYSEGEPQFFMTVSPIKLTQLNDINTKLSDQASSISDLSKTVTANKSVSDKSTENLSKSVSDLNTKATEISGDVTTNTSDIATALESIASLFEMLATSDSTTATDTTEDSTAAETTDTASETTKDTETTKEA